MPQTDVFPRQTWLAGLHDYFAASLAGHLVWEVVQLPLYTIFRNESLAGIAFAVAHCTAGDLLIAGSALLVALLCAGHADWPARRHRRVATLTVVLGVCYTLYSEWFNTTVRHAWAYTDAMPLLPVIEIGLTPVLQWLAIPAIALGVAARRGRAASHGAARAGAAATKREPHGMLR